MTPEILSGLIGLILPFVISFLKSCEWEKKWRFAFAAVVCIAAGAATSYVAGGLVFKPEAAFLDLLIIFGATQVFYKLILEGTGLDQRLTGTPD